jgi:hydroxymethylbilane synthase
MSEGIGIAAVPGREDAREAFVSNRHPGFEALPRGARIGTGSPRRRAQILAARPDLKIVDLRGNVETRLKKLDEGRMDAVILACAGLTRLGLAERITERLPVTGFVPPPGQGALAVTVRSDDTDAFSIVAAIQDPDAAQEVTAERAFLARLGGGCKTPIACHAALSGNILEVTGFVATPDGVTVFKNQVTGTVEDAKRLGQRLAEMLLSKGAGDVLEEYRDV